MRLRTKKRVKRNKRTKILGIVLLTAVILAGCGRSNPSPPQETVLFKPPTSGPTATPTNRSLPSATPTQEDHNCTNQLQFEEDVTVPDGTEVEPGESIVKQWLVSNAGSCNWDERYTINLVSGPDMEAPRSQRLFPARNGQQVIIEMIFTAPEDPGQYTSTWQAFDPQGKRFGDPFFVDIQVVSGQSSNGG